MMGMVCMPDRGSEASWVILTPGVGTLALGHQWLLTRPRIVFLCSESCRKNPDYEHVYV